MQGSCKGDHARGVMQAIDLCPGHLPAALSDSVLRPSWNTVHVEFMACDRLGLIAKS